MPKTKKKNLEELAEELDNIEVVNGGEELSEEEESAVYGADELYVAPEDEPGFVFQDHYVDMQQQISDMYRDSTMSKSEFCNYLEHIRDLEQVRFDRDDGRSMDHFVKSLKDVLIVHCPYPKEYIKDVVDNIRHTENVYEAVNKAERAYFKDVPEEDRFKETQHGKDYSDMVIGEHDIIAEADAINNDLKGQVGTIDDPGDIKKNIELYHKLCQANEQRGWFSKAWSAIKGFFGGRTEDKALADMKANIINSCAYDHDLAVKAMETMSEDHLIQILKTGNSRLIEQQEREAEARENADLDRLGELMDISDNEVEIEATRKKDIEVLNNPDKAERTNDSFEEEFDLEA